MRKVNPTIQTQVLNHYKPNFRYLQDVEIGFPSSNGSFLIQETSYASQSLQMDHLTDVEAQICFNQLCYTAYGHWIDTREIEPLQHLRLEDFFQLMKEDILILESNKLFRRLTQTRTLFDGTIELESQRRSRNLYIAQMRFNLNNNAAEGNFTVAIREPTSS